MNLSISPTSPILIHTLSPFQAYVEAVYPRHPVGVPQGRLSSGRYQLRFASSQDDLLAVQRLRFEVFNLELNEGLAGSYATGLDQDAFDSRTHHLMVLSTETQEVVGTYRLMTAELGAREELYANSEFDLSSMPNGVFKQGIEVGRACIARAHRNGRVLQLLWKGIARYLTWNEKRYVFGCCSVPTLDAAAIAGTSLTLARCGHFHEDARAPVRPALRGEDLDTVVAAEPVALPPLFTSYLRLGAKVVGGPAFDRDFSVTDYLLLLDVRDMAASAMANLAAPTGWTVCRLVDAART